MQLKAQKLGLSRRQTEFGDEWTWGENFRVRAADLEGLDASKLGLARDVPTLVLSDVVLSYLESDWTVALIPGVLRAFERAAFLAFEPVGPHDAFGEQMLLSLRARGLFMPTFAEIGFVPSYRRLLRTGGATRGVCELSWGIYEKWPGRAEADALEWLDEFEQFRLIMDHYAVIFGVKGDVAGVEAPF